MPRHQARGLCKACYMAAGKDGTLADHPRAQFSRDELMAEWAVLRRDGLSRRDAAARLGISFERLDRAYHRAKAAGDPRALPALETAGIGGAI